MQIKQIVAQVEQSVQSKEQHIKLALAGGNVLIEDIPGVGKTTLAKSLATVLGLEFKRIQFTSDMLPSDIIGVNYFDTQASKFVFKRGPIFSGCILADEINRATPKTQSALLEAMEEHQVTVEGKPMALPEHFFVIATQNPLEEAGTFPLPISQLDRFMISMSLGYPDKAAEKRILLEQVEDMELASMDPKHIPELKKQAAAVFAGEKIVEYVMRIITFTRESGLFEYGLSTRAGKQLIALAKAWAMIEGRKFVIDDDIDRLLPNVLHHRVIAKNQSIDLLDEIFKAVHTL